jgi:hypothetical protein
MGAAGGRGVKTTENKIHWPPCWLHYGKAANCHTEEEREVAIIAVLADRGLGGTETTPMTTKSVVFFKISI